MSMGRTYKFFGFSISYTILNLSLSILYLPFILHIPCTFPPSPLPCTPLPSASPKLSSCPWVIGTSSLASTFPILFLTSPCLFSTYATYLCYLFMLLILCTFYATYATIYATYSLYLSPLSPPPTPPADNPPCDLHFCDSVPILVVCLVCFCFCFRCGC